VIFIVIADHGARNGSPVEPRKILMTEVLSPPGPERGRPFVKGRSGNPRGRPVGSRNRKTLAAAVLLAGEAEALTRKAVELALAGDPTALRLCIERILPPCRERAVSLSCRRSRTPPMFLLQ
jgi:Family of unknown function (DUF5681)